MKLNRGFWASAAAASAASLSFVVLAFVRSETFDGDSRGAWILATCMFLSVIPLMLLISAGLAIAGGWKRRAEVAADRWPFARSTMRTDVMLAEIQRVRGTNHRVPWGLTLTANVLGIAIYSGRAQLTLELWLPWEAVHDIQPDYAANGFSSLPAVGILAEAQGQMVRFAAPIVGGFPFGSFPVGDKRIAETVDLLRGMRSEHRTGTRQ